MVHPLSNVSFWTAWYLLNWVSRLLWMLSSEWCIHCIYQAHVEELHTCGWSIWILVTKLKHCHLLEFTILQICYDVCKLSCLFWRFQTKQHFLDTFEKLAIASCKLKSMCKAPWPLHLSSCIVLLTQKSVISSCSRVIPNQFNQSFHVSLSELDGTRLSWSTCCHRKPAAIWASCLVSTIKF